MNDSFFALPVEKQNSMLNAAYHVFAQHDYNKASMSEVAQAGAISKALLFYYFRNKKEFYLYLWGRTVEETKKAAANWKVTETTDFFEMLRRSLLAKCSLLRIYPYMYAFSLKAYFEQEPGIRESIEESFQREVQNSEQIIWARIDTSVFRDDVDLKLLYQEMIWASDGYLRQMSQQKALDADRMEHDFLRLIDQWKRAYLK